MESHWTDHIEITLMIILLRSFLSRTIDDIDTIDDDPSPDISIEQHAPLIILMMILLRSILSSIIDDPSH